MDARDRDGAWLLQKFGCEKQEIGGKETAKKKGVSQRVIKYQEGVGGCFAGCGWPASNEDETMGTNQPEIAISPLSWRRFSASLSLVVPCTSVAAVAGAAAAAESRPCRRARYRALSPRNELHAGQ